MLNVVFTIKEGVIGGGGGSPFNVLIETIFENITNVCQFIKICHCSIIEIQFYVLIISIQFLKVRPFRMVF